MMRPHSGWRHELDSIFDDVGQEKRVGYTQGSRSFVWHAHQPTKKVDHDGQLSRGMPPASHGLGRKNESVYARIGIGIKEYSPPVKGGRTIAFFIRNIGGDKQREETAGFLDSAYLRALAQGSSP